MARQGKIARLPHALREQVNLRLLNGQTARKVLTWLNAEEDAAAVWRAHFEGAAATSQNLSEWRQGGYRDWIRKRDKVENLKTLSSYCLEIAKAGGSVSQGAAAIAAGELLETLESLADDEDADLSKLTSSIASLETVAIAREKIALDREKHATKKEEVKLSREKFEVQTAEQFVKWAGTDAAREILDSGKTKSVQISRLRDLMFGKEGA